MVGLIVLLACIFGGMKARRIHTLGGIVAGDVRQLQAMTAQPAGIELARAAGPQLSTLRQDLAALRREVDPILWITPWLDWVPLHGGDLASASDLLNLAEGLVISADTAFQTVRPILDEVEADGSFDPAELAQWMVQAQPGFLEAQAALGRALAARDRLNVEVLSPDVQKLILQELDPLLPWVDDGLSVAVAFPRLLGAADEGPQTYLLLVQNEDELRPTGGFISAVGTLVVEDGWVASLVFEDSYALDDGAKAYPAAPWQMDYYMNIPTLMFRDSNWFTDYPRAAQYAEYLYTLSRSHAVDGVIAFDQHLLVLLLDALGPLEVQGAPHPITSENVIAYMRSSKIPPPAEARSGEWHRKAFINPIASAILQRLLAGGNVEWEPLFRSLLIALDERHLLLQFDDEALTRLAARQGWDGAVRPGAGDYLLVADANVGYTKSNAVMEMEITYEVKLTDQLFPEGQLTVRETNHAPKNTPCVGGGGITVTSDAAWAYPTDLCYWGYLRVYKSPGTNLVKATPHAVPGSQMILGRSIPARVDVLGGETAQTQAFGTLVLVPGGRSILTRFKFALPAGTVAAGPGAGEFTYRLTVQKQAGTLAIPLTIRVRLPAHARLVSTPGESVLQDGVLTLETNLRTDVTFEVVYSTEEIQTEFE